MLSKSACDTVTLHSHFASLLCDSFVTCKRVINTKQRSRSFCCFARRRLRTVEESTGEGIRQEDSQRIKRERSRKREIVRHIAASERFPWQRDRVLRQEFWRIVVFLSPQQEKRGKNEGEPSDGKPGTLRTASSWIMATIKKNTDDLSIESSNIVQFRYNVPHRWGGRREQSASASDSS